MTIDSGIDAEVDVVIPVHNGADTIEQTIRAAVQQAGVRVRVYVVDDGSTDGTVQIVERLIEELGVSPMVLTSQQNSGPAAARNAGAALGSSPWIAFLDADQVPDRHWLSTLVALGARGDVAGCGGRFVSADGQDRVHRPVVRDRTGRRGIIYQPGHFLVRRAMFELVGGYDSALRYSENTELGFRIEWAMDSRRGTKHVTDQLLVTTSDPPGGRSRQFTFERRLESAEHIIERHGARLGSHQLGTYHAIAGVSARRLGRYRLARSHMLLAIRHRPTRLRYWGGLAVSIRRTREAPSRLALHVMPADLPRGGQAETRTICDELSRAGDPHVALTLFKSGAGNLRPEYCLDVADTRLRRLGFDPGAALALRRFVVQARPDVVVTHGSESLKYALAIPRDVPIVHHRIGVATDLAQRGVRRAFQRLLLRRPRVVVAVSQDAADDVAGFGRRDAVVVPNCRHAAEYEVAERAPGNELKLLFVGHLVASKQPELFVALIQQMRERGHSVVGSIAGEGPLCGSLAAQLPPGVSMLGPRTDIKQVLARHDVLVFTSRREGEGMPGVLIEAGLAGRPVIAFDVPGVRDVVVDGKTGFVVAQDDLDALIAATGRIAEETLLIETMGLAARAHCEQHFDVAVVGSSWRALIDGVRASG